MPPKGTIGRRGPRGPNRKIRGMPMPTPSGSAPKNIGRSTRVKVKVMKVPKPINSRRKKTPWG